MFFLISDSIKTIIVLIPYHVSNISTCFASKCTHCEFKKQKKKTEKESVFFSTFRLIVTRIVYLYNNRNDWINP